MAKTVTEMAVEITTAQASHATMSAEETEAFLRKTYQVLRELRSSEDSGFEQEKRGEGVSILHDAGFTDPKESIQRNKVICLECGKEFKVLTSRHLKDHGMDTKEYRRKYRLSPRQPLAAKSLSAKRRKVAKDLGLGERLQQGRKAKAKLAPPAKKSRKPKAKEQ
jgi:predicted transcriptional regulator